MISMNISEQLAKHLTEVTTGGNWTCANIQDVLSKINLELAKRKLSNQNSILALTYHIHYFAIAITDVLDGKELNSNDKFSYDHPDLKTEEDWYLFKLKIVADFLSLSSKISKLPGEIWNKTFVLEKYRTYYRNVMGLIEHTHYHLGQISLLKK